jgi:hypothetical protein
VPAATHALNEARIGARQVGILVPAEQGIRLESGEGSVPWHGVDQERFSDNSWHGGDISTLIFEPPCASPVPG